MTRVKMLLAVCIVTALAAVPMANAAPVVHLVAAGSSAMYQQMATATVNDIASAVLGATIHHFTTNSTCADSVITGGACVGLIDSRAAVPNETGTFWAVWTCTGACTGANASHVWAYVQVDSTVGVRSFLAQPANTITLAPGLATGVDLPKDLVNAKLLLFGDASGSVAANCTVNPTKCDATSMPADVYAALNGASINAGMTDIRAEDALYATNRSLAALTGSPWDGLGYGPGPVGTPIVSAYSTANATPVAFGLPGTNDPITATPVPAGVITIPIGESPILFLVNRTNPNGLGSFTGVVPFYSNVVDNAGTFPYAPSPLGQLFGGVLCAGSSPAFGLGGATPAGDFPVNPQLREPLSGTMNTTEFSVFRGYGGTLSGVDQTSYGQSQLSVTTSQESNVGAVNPLNSVCLAGGGTRKRNIGTGQEVGTGVKTTQDAIGYAFFSFGNVSTLAGASYGYLKLDGVDPLFANYAGGDPGQPATGGVNKQGQVPTCSVALNGAAGGCLRGDVWTGGNYFPHLVDGTYRAWSLLRALCNPADGHCLATSDTLGLQAIIRNTQDDVHGTGTSPTLSLAEFIPFSDDGSFGPAGTNFGDAAFVRSHYSFGTLGEPATANSGNPKTHTANGFDIFPVGLNKNQSNGVGSGPSFTKPEAGGDAGGCIVRANQSGTVVTIVNSKGTGGNHIKFTIGAAPLSGPKPYGFCGGGFNANKPCNESNTGGSTPVVGTVAAPGQCGSVQDPADLTSNPFGYTCNPTHFPAVVPGDGEGISITGWPAVAPNNVNNGNFQITKLVLPTAIKVKYNAPLVVPASGVAPAGTTGSISAGCSQ